ncbi:MAG TPA: biotin--[acetyl-CoA-carboxylase] ligase [Holophagaceae bacterium]|nr:biotin--[acetyl-CoA-carboxylase] ligase [Holophagaceae bacterium]
MKSGEWPLIHLAQVDSTQAFLKRHPELGFCAVLADSQTAGRGRQGNRWESAPGAGLWMSAALPLQDQPPGLVLQLAMRHALAALPPDPRLGLKWPNDLVARTEIGLVKLGGIIGELSGGRLILGLGINLTGAPDLPDRAVPAACLQALGLPAPQPRELARTLLDRWTRLEKAPEPTFRWPEEGEALRWETGQGVCLGWEADGRLRVATNAGLERLTAAEVRGLRN